MDIDKNLSLSGKFAMSLKLETPEKNKQIKGNKDIIL